jgi:hypothetical protein
MQYVEWTWLEGFPEVAGVVRMFEAHGVRAATEFQ